MTSHEHHRKAMELWVMYISSDNEDCRTEAIKHEQTAIDMILAVHPDGNFTSDVLQHSLDSMTNTPNGELT